MSPRAPVDTNNRNDRVGSREQVLVQINFFPGRVTRYPWKILRRTEIFHRSWYFVPIFFLRNSIDWSFSPYVHPYLTLRGESLDNDWRSKYLLSNFRTNSFDSLWVELCRRRTLGVFWIDRRVDFLRHRDPHRDREKNKIHITLGTGSGGDNSCI